VDVGGNEPVADSNKFTPVFDQNYSGKSTAFTESVTAHSSGDHFKTSAMRCWLRLVMVFLIIKLEIMKLSETDSLCAVGKTVKKNTQTTLLPVICFKTRAALYLAVATEMIQYLS